MIKVICQTNLDLSHEQWPSELPALPHVGDWIQSATVWFPMNFQLNLKVCSIQWRRHGDGNWVPHIELHSGAGYSLQEFYEWYAPKTGKTVESFI
jgi:hypothetical protein